MTFILGLLGVAQSMTDLFTRLEISPAQTIWAIVVFYVILGCFLETLSMLFDMQRPVASNLRVSA